MREPRAALRYAVAPNTSAIRRDAAFPDDTVPTGQAGALSGNGIPTLTLALARQEDETAQLVLRGALDGPPVTVTVTAEPLRHPDGHVLDPAHVSLFVQRYIEVTQPTTPGAVAGWYPDALVPLDRAVLVSPEANQSVWMKVSAPAGQPAGDYTGTLTLHVSGGPPITVGLHVRVWDFDVPVAGKARSAFALWYHQVAAYFGVAADDPDYWTLAERYYRFQIRFRIPPDDLPIPVDLPVEEYLSRAAPFLDSPEVTSFRIPFFPDDEGRSKQLVDALRAKGWLHRGYFYFDDLDEPTAKDLPRLQERARALRRFAPDVPHLITTEPRDDLPVDDASWVAMFDRLDPDRVAASHAEGRQVWWYGCVIPTDPYPTYHLDSGIEGARLLPWMQHRYGVDGALYWSTTVFAKYDGTRYGPRDVWHDPLAYPGANGDGYLLYPGPDTDADPYATLRLEAIREGAEDYEYLRLLDDLTRTVAERFCVEDGDWASSWIYHGRLFTDLRRQTWRPHNLPEVRASVAERIVALGGDLPTLVRVSPTGEIEIVAPAACAVELDGIRPLDRDENAQRTRIRAETPPRDQPTDTRFTVTCRHDGRFRSETFVVPHDPPPPPMRQVARLWPDRQPVRGAPDGQPLALAAAGGIDPGASWRLPPIDGGFDTVVAVVDNPTDEFHHVDVLVHLASGTARVAAAALLAPERHSQIVAELGDIRVSPAEVTGIEVRPRPPAAGAPLRLLRLELGTRPAVPS
ncbi:MAG TPA: DUF4091 domain-containing protein [Jiangellales bacterium]|nr:DUF4091 domain-containing protein [Jiangellales bacterium]